MDIRSWAARQGAPITVGLAASLGLAALAGLLTRGESLAPLVMARPQERPWTLLTYPWAVDPMGLIGLVFLAILLVQFGAQVEREVGTGRFAAFWFAATLLFGGIAAALGIGLAGPWLPSAALLVAWCARNQGAQVMLYGILPLRAAWIAGLAAAGVIVSYARTDPFAALAMALPLGLAWAFGADRLPVPYSAARAARGRVTAVRGARQYDEGYFEDVKAREIEREERERLRKLFEGK